MTDAEWTPDFQAAADQHRLRHGAPMGFLPAHIILDKRLTPAMLKALMAMTVFASGDRLMIHQTELARHLDVSQQALSKVMCQLADLGLIERKETTRGATWRLCWIVAPQPSGPRGVRHDPQPEVVNDPQPEVVKEADSQPEVVAGAHALSTPRTRTTKSHSVSGVRVLCAEERTKIHERYDSQFPRPDVVDELIDSALGNKAVNKWTNTYLYALGWVRRDAERRREHTARMDEHKARMATEQARLERAKTPYGGAVTEPTLKFTNIRDIVGRAS